MSSDDISIYYDLGIVFSWIPTLALFSMYGAYISSTNIKHNCYSKFLRWEINMFYRPVIICIIISIAITLFDFTPRLKNALIIFYINSMIFCISDLLILKRKILNYIFIATILAMWNFISLFVVLTCNSNDIFYIYLYFFILILLILYYFIKLNILSLMGLMVFIRNIKNYLFVKLKYNITIVLSSFTIGVLGTVDRLSLPFINVSKFEFANYFALVSLTIPINYFSAVYGKYIMIKTISSKDSLNRYGILNLIIFILSINLITFYIQRFYIEKYTNYEFCTYTQLLLNCCAIFLLFSKKSTAFLYKNKKSSNLLQVNIFCILSFTGFVYLGFESMFSFAIIKFVIYSLYIVLLYMIEKNALSWLK